MDDQAAPTTHIDRGNSAWRVVWRAGYVVARRLGRLVRLLVRLRVPSFDNEIVELSLMGRHSGRPRPVLVTLIRVGAAWYVGHPNGPRPWLSNLAAADTFDITLPRQEPVRVRAVPLRLGPERDAVIRETGFQQPSPVRPLYRAARNHILRAGIYYRLEPVGTRTRSTRTARISGLSRQGSLTLSPPMSGGCKARSGV